MDSYLFILFQYLVPKKFISELIGFFAKSQNYYIKTFFIKIFQKIYNVNLKEAIYEDVAFYIMRHIFIVSYCLHAEAFSTFLVNPFVSHLNLIDNHCYESMVCDKIDISKYFFPRACPIAYRP